MKPLSATEVRAEVSRLPEQYRENALRILAAAFDEGMSAALVGAPRASNPFLPPKIEQGKRKR